MPTKLHIDIETFSSVDLKRSGVYKYAESDDFQILLIAYAYNNDPVQIIDLASGEIIPQQLIEDIQDKTIEKHAHNANFERVCLTAHGIKTSPGHWHCSASKAAYCGLPLSLDEASSALGLGDKAKLKTGKKLIKLFCTPQRPSLISPGGRALPDQHPEAWEDFKTYCIQDVVAEREIDRLLDYEKPPQFERNVYILDQIINDRGIQIDERLACAAYELYQERKEDLIGQMRAITGLTNPNSPPQLKAWLSNATGEDIQSLAKGNIGAIKEAGGAAVKKVLDLRSGATKSSASKYKAMQECLCGDGRVRGLFKYYGANRTGRWAGRLVQLQNIARNYMDGLEAARDIVKAGDYGAFLMAYESPSSVLSQLIRTALVAPEGKTFAVADFSAIEARVLGWLANETWRTDVFKTHGKIYEASAAMMFNMPIESIDKGSDLRSKGKVAELALGYQGSIGALIAMGADKMGLSEREMKDIVSAWRGKSPRIVNFWYALEDAALRCVKARREVRLPMYRSMVFNYEQGCMTVRLPSGRKLYYREAQVCENRFGKESIRYRGVDQDTKQWGWVDTYGGKLCENITQAVARDLLACSMIEMHRQGKYIVMHVHDEVVVEVATENAEQELDHICEIMGKTIPWAEGLPLTADGYITNFYKKD